MRAGEVADRYIKNIQNRMGGKTGIQDPNSVKAPRYAYMYGMKRRSLKAFASLGQVSG